LGGTPKLCLQHEEKKQMTATRRSETIPNMPSPSTASRWRENSRPPAVLPLVVAPAEAMVMLDCKLTYLYQLINQGELESYREGKHRKIVVESIHQLINRRRTEAKAEAGL
jgi:excisionase family DNA binding protein